MSDSRGAPTIDVIAHRGGAGVWVENTMSAFAAATTTGCVLETDVRCTADGVPVCFHDETTDRVTGRRGRVADLPFTVLARWCEDAGLPLVGVARLLTELPTARIVLDIKDPAVVPALAPLLRANDAGRVCATGSWDGVLARLRARTGPELGLGLGWRGLARLAAPRGARFRPDPGVQWAFLPVALATPRVIGRARSHGLRVGVWTVDDPARAIRFVRLGADAITTDRPELVLPALRCSTVPACGSDVPPRMISTPCGRWASGPGHRPTATPARSTSPTGFAGGGRSRRSSGSYAST